MILIEMFLDSSKQMFLDVPFAFHGELINLYSKNLKASANKPQFVKLSSFELIRIKYIQEDFKPFNVDDIVEEFTIFYHKQKKQELEKVKFGFEEDVKDFIWEYLQSN